MAVKKLTIILLIFCFVLAGGSSILHADESDLAARVGKWREDNELAIVRDYARLLAMPNVADDLVNIRANAVYILAELEKRGVSGQLLQLEGAPPTVFGELNVGADKTVVIYAHYDGQPADPVNWSSPPWEPVVRDNDGNVIDLENFDGALDPEWRIYARSAGDDKVAVFAILTALDAMHALNIQPDVNMKFFFEGEEEAGSAHLQEMLEKYSEILDSDGWIFCDGPVHQSRRPMLYFGARGVVGLQMTVYGPNHALHSGHYGNWAPNAISVLVDLLASMRNADGEILIDGFAEATRQITESEQKALDAIPDIDEELRAELDLSKSEADNARLVERIMLPALNFQGISSGGVRELARNAIPTEAVANVGFRLVPDLSPEIVKKLVEEHIRKQGFHIVFEEPNAETRRSEPNLIYLSWGKGYMPSRTNLDHPFSKALITTIENSLNIDLINMPTTGGSLPMRIFSDTLGAPVIVLPIANHDDNQHAPDENLRLQNLWDGIAIYVAVFSEIGGYWN